MSMDVVAWFAVSFRKAHATVRRHRALGDAAPSARGLRGLQELAWQWCSNRPDGSREGVSWFWRLSAATRRIAGKTTSGRRGMVWHMDAYGALGRVAAYVRISSRFLQHTTHAPGSLVATLYRAVTTAHGWFGRPLWCAWREESEHVDTGCGGAGLPGCGRLRR